MLTLDSRLNIPGHVTSSFVDEDVVLLNMRTNQYFAMQEISARLWRLVKDGKGLREACLILQTEFAVGPQELEADVLELVRQLMENGLVEVAEG